MTMRSWLTIAGIALASSVGTWQPALALEPSQSSPEHHERAAARTLADQILADRIVVRLAGDVRVGSEIRVRADRGLVTLTGSVPSEQARARALRIARRTPGVLEVRDHLGLGHHDLAAPVALVEDAQLARRAAEEIAHAIPGAKAGEDWWLIGWRVEGPDNRWHLTVEAENGTIWLNGEVPRDAFVRTAVDAARRTAGVRRVQSHLAVERWRSHDAAPVPSSYGDFPYGYAPYRDGHDRPADPGKDREGATSASPGSGGR